MSMSVVAKHVYSTYGFKGCFFFLLSLISLEIYQCLFRILCWTSSNSSSWSPVFWYLLYVISAIERCFFT